MVQTAQNYPSLTSYKCEGSHVSMNLHFSHLCLSLSLVSLRFVLLEAQVRYRNLLLFDPSGANRESILGELMSVKLIGKNIYQVSKV